MDYFSDILNRATITVSFVDYGNVVNIYLVG